jgi:ABC-2 type transport system ATP-binding protein
MSPMTAISTRDLTRVFKTASGVRTAADRLTLEVPEGVLFTLLGPNGAGKTTVVKLLTTLLLPSQGIAMIYGYDVVKDVRVVRRLIGVSFGGDRGLYTRATLRENLQYFANLYDLPYRQIRGRTNQLLNLVGLADRAGEPVERLSRGLRQRLHLARALLHDPAVLFLDEPSVGLDPWAARDLRLLLRSLRQQGKTIVLTTHSMTEAEELSDHIVIMARGRSIRSGSVAGLRQSMEAGAMVEVEGPWIDPEHCRAWEALPGVTAVRGETRESLHVVTMACRDHDQAQVVRLQVARLYPRYRLAVRDPTLEDAYLHVTQQVDQEGRFHVDA